MSVIYHYTNAAGLQGIVASGQLWATDYRFLNDSSEFRDGISLLGQELALQRSIIESYFDSWPLIEDLIRYAGQDNYTAMVFSLTTDGDLLSQWRGYNNGKGFAIGFNTDHLINNSHRQKFELFPVRYELEDQQAAMRQVISDLITALGECMGGTDEKANALFRWWPQGLKAAAVVKNVHFKEEHEQRLAYVGKVWPPGIQLRTGAVGLVPYLPFNLADDALGSPAGRIDRLGIERIVVGPSLGKEQIAAVNALLRSHNVQARVEKSDIPYTAD